MIALATLLAGLVLMVVGGTLLVRGAADLAASFGVSPMVVGLTVVGFGTSAPELVVNTVSAYQGATGLAFGNVIGSNISNMALVLGAAAIMTPITIKGELVRREIPLLLLVTSIMAVMATDGFFEDAVSAITRSDAVILLLLFLVFLYFSISDLLHARRDPLLEDAGDFALVSKKSAGHVAWLYVLAGIVMLFFGGNFTVDGAVGLAGAIGITPTVVGLFVVAVGTSMPELVTSVIAAMRGESDLAIGNVIGSNLFNSLIVLPVTGLVAPITMPAGGIGDLFLSWLLVALLVPVFYLRGGMLGRNAGIALLLGYFGYAAFRLFATPA